MANLQTLNTIILKALELGYERNMDINGLIRNCVDYKHFDGLIRKHEETDYNHTTNHTVFMTSINYLLKNKLIDNAMRGKYKLTDKGLNHIQHSTVNIDDYMDIIKGEKDFDALVRCAKEKMDLYDNHPLRIKYYYNHKLKLDLKQFGDCDIVYHFTDTKLYIDIFGYNGDFNNVYDNDIVLRVIKDKLIFKDL
jgi:hypothetical protein